jgi:hypothetical protein
MPATREQSNQSQSAYHDEPIIFSVIDEEEEMTRMQRLQPWLMAGIALFGLSAAVIGLALNSRVSQTSARLLQFVSYGLLGIGGLLIIAGIINELAVPGLKWRFGARGKLYRSLQVRTKEGRKIGKIKEWIPQRDWAQTVIEILNHDDAGDWAPEIEEIDRLGNPSYERLDTRQCTPNEVLARQIRSVEQFAAKLRRGEV